jgi:hypothetical protein
MSQWRKKHCTCRLPENEASGLLFDDSGFLGRRIIRLYQFMHDSGHSGPTGGTRRWKLRRLLDRAGVSAMVDFLYTYGIGGSLTRRDQLIFARFHSMENQAYRLTLMNSIVFGIPSVGLYFAAGEGFELLSRLNSVAELPSLVAAQVSFGLGIINAAVHLFRIFDSLLHRRCWAPFGAVPLFINLPTYLKTAKRKFSGRRSGPGDCDCP